jgi:hypothetical protein
MHSINKNTSPQDHNLPDTSKKRSSSAALTPPYTSKNRFSPLLTLQDNGEMNITTQNDSSQQSVYNIFDYVNFHTSLAHITFENVSIINTKSGLKLNLNSIDDATCSDVLYQ